MTTRNDFYGKMNQIQARASERINILENIINKLKGTEFENLTVFFVLAIENIKYIINGECDIDENTQNELIKNFIKAFRKIEGKK